MNTFQTETDPRFARRIYGLSVGLGILAFMIAAPFIVSFQLGACIFLEGLILLCGGITLLITLKNAGTFTLTFEGDELHIEGARPNQSFLVYEIPKSDFIFKQSKAEQAANCGSIRFKSNTLHLYGVKNFDALKKYVEENYQ